MMPVIDIPPSPGRALLATLLLACCLVKGLPGAEDATAARDAAIVEALLRLPNVRIDSNPQLKAAVLRHLETKRGTARYLELVEKLQVRDGDQQLLAMVVDDPTGTLGVKAATLLVRFQQLERLREALTGEDEGIAESVAIALSNVAESQTLDILWPLVTDLKRSVAVRSAAARGVARSRAGQHKLLELVKTDQLPADLNFTVANALFSAADEAIRQQVAQHLQLPVTASAEPLPPVAQLVQTKGDAGRGETLFKTTATCAKCHLVRKQGKEVGPDLSEIGSKLSREAMFVAILDPSAGISHSYETYAVALDSGNVLSGILVSETAQAVTLKDAEAIVREIPKSQVEQMVKQTTSLMPADLQKNLTAQDLVDVVEYLGTLTKPGT